MPVFTRPITVDHTQVGGSTLSDFWVFVVISGTYIKTTGNGGDVQNASGYDIVFSSDSAGASRLKWATIRYDASGGLWVGRVKLTSVSSSVDTVFYVQYGDTGITTDQSDPANTFDTNKKGYWPVEEATFTNLGTSPDIGGSNGATINGTGMTSVTAQDGATRAMAGGSLDASNNGATTAYTYSFWWKGTSNPGTGSPDQIIRGGTSSDSIGMNWSHNNAAFRQAAQHQQSNGTYIAAKATTTLVGGTWYHIAITHTGTALKIYVNGTNEATGTTDGTVKAFTGVGFRIAAGAAGSIDEIKLANVARAGGWIIAEYNNEKSGSTFLAIGAVLGSTASPDPATSSWTAKTPTITLGGATASPASAVHSWAVPTAAGLGGQTANPGAAVSTWHVLSATGTNAQSRTPLPAVSTWVARTPAVRRAAAPRVRLEIWSNLKCNGGTRLCFVKDAATLLETESLEGNEGLTFLLPLISPAGDEIREGRVARIRFANEDFKEFWISTVVKRRHLGGAFEVACLPVIAKLGTASPVPEPANTQLLPALDVGLAEPLTAEEIIQSYILDNPTVAAELPWLTLGTIEPTVEISVSWSSASPLAVLRAIVDAIEATGEPCELSLRRVGTASYAIDLLNEIGSTAAKPHIRFRRNLATLDATIDPTDRATRIEALAAPLGGESTYLGAARWIVTAVDDDAKTCTLADPAGGKGPIGFDNQLVGWFLFREKTGGTFEITDSDADTQTLTLAAWTTLAVGEYVQFRTSEPLSGTKTIGSGHGGESVFGTTVQPLQISAIAGSVFTVQPFGGSVPIIARDGQYADARATFAAFVSLNAIVGTNNISAVTHTITLTGDLSDIQVDDLAYECGNAVGVPHYFDSSKPLRITAIDTMAGTVDVELYDDPVAFVRLQTSTELLTVRPQPGSALVVTSDAGDGTLTLDLDEDAEDWAVTEDVGLLFLALATGQGEEPYYLDHPEYIADIGVKFGTIDRGDTIGVANLCPNALMREWADPDEPPDGWSTRSINDGVTIAKNTDPLFTQLGGNSLYFELTNGGNEMFSGINAIISPPIPWTAVREGERFSVRASMVLTEWEGDIALEMKLGVQLADGTVKTWDAPDATAFLFPPDFTDPPKGGDPTIGDVWISVALVGVDITSPGKSQRITAGDLANAVGYVVVFAQAKGTVKGYLDAVMVVPAFDVPEEITEFGGANNLWQTVNLALAQLAPPQVSYAVQIVDLARLDPSLAGTDTFVKGGTAYVTDLGLGLRNIAQRVVEIVWNWKKRGDTKIVLASRARRLTDLLIKAQLRARKNAERRVKDHRVRRPIDPVRPGFSWLDWYDFLHGWDVTTGENLPGDTVVDTGVNWTLEGGATVTPEYTTINGKDFTKLEDIGTSAVFLPVTSHQDFPSLPPDPSLRLGQQLRLKVPVKAVAGVDGYFWTRIFATDEDSPRPARWLAQVQISIAAGVVTATAVTGTVLAVTAKDNGVYEVIILATEGNEWPLNDETEIILIDGPAYDTGIGYATLFPTVLDPARPISAIDAVLIGPVELYSYVPGSDNQAVANHMGAGTFTSGAWQISVSDEVDNVADWFDHDYWFNIAPELRRNSPLGAWSSSNPAVLTVDATTGHATAVGVGTANLSWSVTTPSGTVTSNTVPYNVT